MSPKRKRARRIAPPPIDCAVCLKPFKDGDQYHWTAQGWAHIDCATTEPNPTDPDKEQ